MWATAGQDVNFTVDYLVDGEYVIPSEAWATVRGHTGSAIVSLTDVELDVSSTSDLLVIPAAQLALGPGEDFQNRYVDIRFIYAGRQYHKIESFRIIPFLPITVTADDVRSELGLDNLELRDREIDIPGAYLLLNREYPLADALLEMDATALAANAAIRVKAALEIVDSLPFRVAIKAKSEDTSMDRMAEFDVERIRITLAQRLTTYLDIVEGNTFEGTPSLVLALPTDPITGA